MARMFNPPHPGELLREFLPEGMTIEEVAGRLGVSRVQLSRVLKYHTRIVARRTNEMGFMASVAETTSGRCAVSSRVVAV
jgi:antitoxin HigA-1